MAAFIKQACLDFERAAMRDLMMIYPEECEEMGSSKLLSFVRHGVEKALRYQIDQEEDILSFLYLAIENGESFDQDPAFPACRAILEHRSLTGQAKIDLLYELFETTEG